MVDEMSAPRRLGRPLSRAAIALSLATCLGTEARADDPCSEVESAPAVSHASSVPVTTGARADLVSAPPVFNWETATMTVTGQVNINRSKYQDSVCFLFFCHDVTRIRDNFVSPEQYPVSLALVTPGGEIIGQPTSFSGPAASVPGTPNGSDPHEQTLLKAAIAPDNGGIVRRDCAADPEVCSTGSYSVTVAISSGGRAKRLAEFLGTHRLTYGDIVTESILNANLRASSPKVRNCVARGLLSQAKAFHGPGTGESPVERQQILQEALSLSPDDVEVKTALASTYVETGQYAQARAAGESSVSDLEKRVAAGIAGQGEYDALSDAYAVLAEVDWREVAGISTAGVAGGVAHLRMALDRTDKRLALFPFGTGADEARRKRAGHAMRLAGMLARQGSFESIRGAAEPLSRALELLPESATGVPVAADIVRGELITSVPLDRVVVDRSWSEKRTDAWLRSDFVLSPFEADSSGRPESLVAWRKDGREIVDVGRVVQDAVPPSALLAIGSGCSVVEAVGAGAGEAIAIVRGGQDCLDPESWSIQTKSDTIAVTGTPRSMVVSIADGTKARRVATVTATAVRSWIVDEQGKLKSDREWPGADAVRTGPDPSQLAVRKGKRWTVATFAETKWIDQEVICTAGDGEVEDVALVGDPGLLAVGKACGLSFADLPKPTPALAGEPSQIRLASTSPSKVTGGAWPVSGSLRFAWTGGKGDPVAVIATPSNGEKVKLLAFAGRAAPPPSGVERMDLYIADVDPAYTHKRDGDFRVLAVGLQALAVENDKNGRQAMWPKVDVIARGALGSLLGLDLKLRRPVQKSAVRNAADFVQLRRGRSHLWGLSAKEDSIESLGEGAAATSVRLLDRPARETMPSFAMDEDASTAQVVWTTTDSVERLDIIPFSGTPVAGCNVSAAMFGPGTCGGKELTDALGKGQDERILLISQHTNAAEARPRPMALAIVGAAEVKAIPFPLGRRPFRTFPISSSATAFALSDDPDPTLFALRDGKVVAIRGGAELGQEDAPDWLLNHATRRFSSAGRLLAIGGSPFSYVLYDATGDALTAKACDTVCPLAPDLLRDALKDSDLGPLALRQTTSVTASGDLSMLAFVSQAGSTFKWHRAQIGQSAQPMSVRPGLPLLYSAGAEEDILAIRAGPGTVEQWSLKGTAPRTRNAPPAAAPGKVDRDAEATVTFMAFFGEASDQPLPTSASDLRTAAECLVAWREATIDVLGFANSTGSPVTNQALSQRRADRVADALLASGVGRERLAGRALGKGEQGAEGAGVSFGRRAEIRAKGLIKADVRGKCGIPSTTQAAAR